MKYSSMKLQSLLEPYFAWIMLVWSPTNNSSFGLDLTRNMANMYNIWFWLAENFKNNEKETTSSNDLMHSTNDVCEVSYKDIPQSSFCEKNMAVVGNDCVRNYNHTRP